GRPPAQGRRRPRPHPAQRRRRRDRRPSRIQARHRHPALIPPPHLTPQPCPDPTASQPSPRVRNRAPCVHHNPPASPVTNAPVSPPLHSRTSASARLLGCVAPYPR